MSTSISISTNLSTALYPTIVSSSVVTTRSQHFTQANTTSFNSTSQYITQAKTTSFNSIDHQTTRMATSVVTKAATTPGPIFPTEYLVYILIGVAALGWVLLAINCVCTAQQRRKRREQAMMRRAEDSIRRRGYRRSYQSRPASGFGQKRDTIIDLTGHDASVTTFHKLPSPVQEDEFDSAKRSVE